MVCLTIHGSPLFLGSRHIARYPQFMVFQGYWHSTCGTISPDIRWQENNGVRTDQEETNDNATEYRGRRPGTPPYPRRDDA